MKSTLTGLVIREYRYMRCFRIILRIAAMLPKPILLDKSIYSKDCLQQRRCMIVSL